MIWSKTIDLVGIFIYFSALPFFVELSFQPSNSKLNFTPAVFDRFQQYWLMLTFPGPLCSESADLFTFHRWSLHGFRGNNNKNTIFICRMHYVLMFFSRHFFRKTRHVMHSPDKGKVLKSMFHGVTVHA